jgi:hypothetical protein
MAKVVEDPRFGTPSDIAFCRAADIGIRHMAECLRQGPNFCSFALPFGYCFLCQHPRIDEIVAQTTGELPGWARVEPS